MKKTRRLSCLRNFYYLLLTALLCNISATYANSEKLSTQPAVQNFIHLMVERHQFDGNNLANLIDTTPLLENVLTNIQHPYEEQPWYVYRAHLVNNKRILAGVEYWKNHEEALLYAEKKYGVPANIIVAIIGIESLYGQAHFKYSVLSSLVTLSFVYPPRANFFQQELEQYLLLAHDLGVDPHSIYGSYAGAIGLPQFMPSNYRKYAVSYTDLITNEHPKIDSTKDSVNNPETKILGDITKDTDDVVVSVASFLHHFGWEKDQPVAMLAKVKGEKYQQLLGKKPNPSLTVAQLKKLWIIPSQGIDSKTKATFIQLQNENSYEYWLGFNNFHVLSRYNGDKQYIMAVYQLAIELKKAKVSSL